MADAADSPIIRFVDYVLKYAVKRRASDIHIETFTHNIRIRLRIDGLLIELPAPDRKLGDSIISCIKTLAKVNLSEKRLPQDGHIECNYFDRSVDFRLSTLPTQYGESVVIRVLDKGSWHFDLNKIGIAPQILTQLRQAFRSGSGIILTTGPTGSGKTTTLYSALQEINGEETKIITIEDPVEYETEGIVQVNVRNDIGLSFESALRAFLRHDPDKILIGELRDTTTAKIAVQAALTGHLVLGTLHTNDAPSSITRLIDMGIDPYLIADTVKGILAQRLLRRICPNCKEKVIATSEEKKIIGNDDIDKIHRGKGCEQCDNTGCKGRFAIYEWMPINFEIRNAIRKRLSLDELHELALKNGLIPLKIVALQALRKGTISHSELEKV
jgi:type IV pilus assembly protein PilB